MTKFLRWAPLAIALLSLQPEPQNQNIVLASVAYEVAVLIHRKEQDEHEEDDSE